MESEAFSKVMQEMLRYCHNIGMISFDYTLLVPLGVASLIFGALTVAKKISYIERFWKGTGKERKNLNELSTFLAACFFFIATIVNLNYGYKIVVFAHEHPNETLTMLEKSKSDSEYRALNNMMIGYGYIDPDTEHRYGKIYTIGAFLGLSTAVVFYPEEVRAFVKMAEQKDRLAGKKTFETPEEVKLIEYLFTVIPVPMVILYFWLMALVVRMLILAGGFCYYHIKYET